MKPIYPTRGTLCYSVVEKLKQSYPATNRMSEITNFINSDTKSVSRALSALTRRGLVKRHEKTKAGYFEFSYILPEENPVTVPLPVVPQERFKVITVDFLPEESVKVERQEIFPAHYKRKTPSRDVKLKKINHVRHNLPPFITISEAVGWDRIGLLKRLKTKLIEEHHYVLDVIISDYESILRLNQQEDD